jgi:cation:H+ antiporter
MKPRSLGLGGYPLDFHARRDHDRDQRPNPAPKPASLAEIAMDALLVVRAVAGLLALIIGAELLVRRASTMAQRLGVSALVVGLTVVAFGTSAPELAVAVRGAIAGQSDVVVGNVLGSNVFNIGLILGMSALITPLVVADKLIRREVPAMIVISVAALLMALGGHLGRIEGAVLVGAFAIYLLYTLRASRASRAEVSAEYGEAFGKEAGSGRLQIAVDLALVAVGLALLVVGSQWFVEAAVDVAQLLEIDELVISLTIVAGGTSLPELATSILAAFRGERDIAVGNVVGSNIFNLTLVLGVATVVSPDGVGLAPGVLALDFPLVLALSVACLPIFFSGHLIDRWEGAVFVIYYVSYTTYLVLAASDHANLEPFSNIVLAFVVPVTLITIAVILVRSLRSKEHAPPASCPPDR